MKKKLLICALSVMAIPSLAMAEAGDIVVRLRATDVAPDESSKLGHITDKTYGAGIANAVYGSPDAELRLDNNTIPEIDFSYYLTKNIAAELILALGTRHDVSVSGSGGALTQRSLGSVNMLPPTLTLQWHFRPDETFDPYAGVGLTYMRAMDNSLTAHTTLGNLPIRVERNSFGPAVQAGFDINLEKRWLINFDIKKIWADADVKLNAAGAGLPGGYRKIDSLDIDPWVISIGFGKKF